MDNTQERKYLEPG